MLLRLSFESILDLMTGPCRHKLQWNQCKHYQSEPDLFNNNTLLFQHKDVQIPDHVRLLFYNTP